MFKNSVLCPKIISAFAVFCALAHCGAAFAAERDSLRDCGARIAVAADFPLMRGEDGSAVVKEYKSKGAGGKTSHVLFAMHFNSDPSAWEEMKFSFVPSESGVVRLSLSGVEKRRGASVRKLASYYDDLKIDGAPHPNGGFENGFAGFSFANPAPKIVFGSNRAASGGACLRAWSRTYTCATLKVERGRPCEISVMTRPAGELPEIEDAFIDISAAANSSENSFPKAGAVAFDGINFWLAGSDGAVKTLRFPPKNGKPAKISVGGENRAGRYLYLLHRMDNSASKPDAYIASVIVKTTGNKPVKRFVKIDRDCGRKNAYAPAHNAKAVFFGDAENKRDVWYLSRFETGGLTDVEEITFNTWADGDWSIAAATLSDTDVPTFEVWKPAPDKWAAADIPAKMSVLENSALDLSRFFPDAEAGAFGRVIVSPRGTMAFEKTPERDARFKSFTMSLAPFFRIADIDARKRSLKSYAAQIRRAGYNCVRMEFEQFKSHSERKNFKTAMDCLDYFFSELKKNGVYVHLVITWQELGERGFKMGEMRDDSKLRCLFGDKTAWRAWRNVAELQLNHFNPYTNLAWKDDPMFLQVEHFNELSIVLSRLKRGTPRTQKLVLSKWRKWLEKKYGTVEKLNESWNRKGFVYNSGTFDYADFSEVGEPFVKNPDWQEFALDRKTRFLKFCNKTVRETGYKGIIASENVASSPAQNVPRGEMFESIISNTYFAHPTGLNTKDAATRQNSCIGDAFPNLGSVLSRRFADRPIGITEFNHCWWNMRRYEVLGTFAPYAAFQNMSMLTIHEDIVPSDVNGLLPPHLKLNPFRICRSPIVRASELLSACFFVRGDVARAKSRVDMVMAGEYFEKNPIESQKAVNSEQMKVALLTGFAVDCGGARPDSLKSLAPKPADMRMPPIGSSDTIMEAWFQDVVPNADGGGFDLRGFVAKMRENKILPAGNSTDISRGIFQTDTGEITMNVPEKSLKISTPKSQLLVSESGVGADLGNLKVLSSSVPAAVAAASLDGLDLGKSRRIVLIYATAEANTDMKTSFDFLRMLDSGKAPILLKTGTLKAELKLDPTAKYAVYPLSLDGARRAPIPAKSANGVLKLEIDTSGLPHGATTLFEIAAVGN